MQTESAQVAARLGEINTRIRLAARDAIRSRRGAPSDLVRVVAVTKYLQAGEMAQLRAGGLEIFGESRVQDALPKVDGLQGAQAPLEWHFIGTLQGNKVRAVVGRFALIHSVDRLDLARRVSDAAMALGMRQSVLLQVKVSGEERKHGFTPDELCSAWPLLADLPGLRIRGLMGMAAAEEGMARPAFRALRLLRERLDPARRTLVELSMGMSGDYEDAVAEGATLVRIGRYLFSEEAGI